MRRGSVPMRVRRRQSDAKWRASVATCYEALKHVIPDCDKISKRKISKALILQETEKHINNLENVLTDILSDKARCRGKVVLYQTDQGLVEANLSDVQQDLTIKQQTMYLQNYGHRKKSSIPSDIEAGIINLRSTYCPLTVLPAECLQQHDVPSTQDLSSLTTEINYQSKLLPIENKENILTAGFCPVMKSTNKDFPLPFEEYPYESQSTSLLLTPVKTRQKRTKRTSTCMKDFEYYSPGEITPDKNSVDKYMPITPQGGHKHRRHNRTPLRASNEVTPKGGHKHRHPNRTPLRASNELPLDNNTGFTPVKLPTDLDNGSEAGLSDIPTGFTPIKLPTEYDSMLDMETGFTPVKLPTTSMLPESPFTTICMKTLSPDSRESLDREYAWSEQLGLTSLLCDETIDQMDLGDVEDLAKTNSRTPQNSVKPKEDRNKTEKGKKFRSATVTSSTSSVENSQSTHHKAEAKCRRQLEKCFEVDKENIPVIKDEFDNTDTSCLDFDGYFLFYQYVAGDKTSDTMMKGEMATQVSQMWREMPEDTRDTFIAMAALEGSQSQSSHLSDDLKELDVKPIEKHDVIPLVQKKETPAHQIMLPFVQQPQPLQKSRAVPKTYRFFLPENKDHTSLQEVPVNQMILPYTSDQILVPEMSEQVTVLDTSESAVVPEMTSDVTDEDILQMDQTIGQNVEVYADHDDFHMVPNKECLFYNSDRVRADDLGFISLSNENSMSDEFSHQFSHQVTVEDLTEWKGQIVPIVP